MAKVFLQRDRKFVDAMNTVDLVLYMRHNALYQSNKPKMLLAHVTHTAGQSQIGGKTEPSNGEMRPLTMMENQGKKSSGNLAA